MSNNIGYLNVTNEDYPHKNHFYYLIKIMSIKITIKIDDKNHYQP